MPQNQDNESIYNEPYLQPDRKQSDPSEKKAEKILRAESDTPDPSHRSSESIYDELDIFPGRQPEVINQDWSCSECGYNLRGLDVGHPCPECGHRELYRPAPPDADSYQMWLRRRLTKTSATTGWLVAFVVAGLGGIFAVVAALLGTQQPGFAGLSMLIMVAVYGPAVEETLKIAVAAMIIEVRPYLFRRTIQIQTATVGAAFVFAVIENLIYLTIYVPHAGIELILWRWTVCVAMHVICTAVATQGLIEVWKHTVTEFRQPQITRGIRMLVMAIIFHGFYNCCALFYQHIG